MNHKLLECFILSILFQLTVLIGEYVTHVYPHWTGEEIRLKIRPVDPRSLFRGQYVNLDYNLSSMSDKLVTKFEKQEYVLKHGQIIFISLVNKDGISVPDDVFIFKPSNKIFIQGRIDRKYKRSINRSHSKFVATTPKIKLGIEAYFTSPNKAKTIENSMRNNRSDNAFACVMLTTNGKAALKDLLINQ